MKFNFLNSTINLFEKVTRSQAKKGFKKYGQTLDPYETGRNWLAMEREELIDAFQYNKAMEDRLLLATSKIRELSANHADAGAHLEIEFWLDFLEGK